MELMQNIQLCETSALLLPESKTKRCVRKKLDWIDGKVYRIVDVYI